MFISDEDNETPLIRNEDTLRRRAWIDRALAGVRERLKPDEIGELPASAQPATPEVPVMLSAPAADPVASRPRLYMIRNRSTR